MPPAAATRSGRRPPTHYHRRPLRALTNQGTRPDRSACLAPARMFSRPVPFVAGELVERLVGSGHRQPGGPRRRVPRRIVHRELVDERVVRGSREALLEHQRRAARAVPAADTIRIEHRVAEVGGRDHQAVALPAAARVAQPLADAVRQIRAVSQPHDPGAVHHLVQKDHVLRGLEDLDVLVVRLRLHGRPRVESHEAADEQAAGAEVLHEAARRRRVVIHAGPRRRQLVDALLRRCGQRRHPAVGWIDDERRLPRLARTVGPEAIVGAGVARQRRIVVLVVARRDPALLPLCGFLLRQHQPITELLRPVQRGVRREVPHALQVGVAPGRAGTPAREFAGCLGRRRHGNQRDCRRDQNAGAKPAESLTCLHRSLRVAAIPARIPEAASAAAAAGSVAVAHVVCPDRGTLLTRLSAPS